MADKRILVSEETAGLVSSNTATPTLALRANSNTRNVWAVLRRDSLTAITDHVLLVTYIGTQVVPLGALSVEHPNLYLGRDEFGALLCSDIYLLAVTNSPDAYVSRSVEMGGF